MRAEINSLEIVRNGDVIQTFEECQSNVVLFSFSSIFVTHFANISRWSYRARLLIPLSAASRCLFVCLFTLSTPTSWAARRLLDGTTIIECCWHNNGKAKWEKKVWSSKSTDKKYTEKSHRHRDKIKNAKQWQPQTRKINEKKKCIR